MTIFQNPLKARFFLEILPANVAGNVKSNVRLGTCQTEILQISGPRWMLQCSLYVHTSTEIRYPHGAPWCSGLTLEEMYMMDAQVEDMLKRSFAEFRAQTDAPEQKALLVMGQKALDALRGHPWPHSMQGTTRDEVQEYYALCHRIEQLGSDVQVNSTDHPLPPPPPPSS